MEWLVISVAASVLGLFLIAMGKIWEGPNVISLFASAAYVIGALIIAISWLVSPLAYYSSRNEALEAEAYYENILRPAMVEEHQDYIVVDSLQGAIWQSGDQNLPSYNSYLRSNRYWDQNGFWGKLVYPAPAHLKPARVVGP